MRARAMTDKLRPWLDQLPVLLSDVDPDTAAFCVQSLRRICDEDLLARKLESELGHRTWVPLGRVLVVVSENDIFGACLALLGACLTGNAVRIKARHTRRLLASLCDALAVDNCELLDWNSLDQDDAAVLAGIDAVLIAGGDDVICHYRRIAPAHVRLVEWGPKMSAAAVGRDANPADRDAVDRLVADVSLFGQRVCSAPQLIVVDPGPAEALFTALEERLSSIASMNREERLAQHVRASQLELLGRIRGVARVSLDRTTGWGVTLSHSPAPEMRLYRGFALVVGDLPTVLAQLATQYRRRLQTLGVWGFEGQVSGFTRICPIGRMHARSPLEPHDGVLELPTLVDFVAS